MGVRVRLGVKVGGAARRLPLMKQNDITYAKFTHFVQSKALSVSSKRQYLRQVLHLARYYPQKSLARITETEVLDYLIHRRDELQVRPPTLNQGLVAIRSLYRDLLGKNWKLWAHFKVRFDRPLPMVLSQNETAHFLDCVQEGRFLAPLSLIYHCGLRLSECLNLRPADIDSQRLVIRLPSSKGRKEREVPLAPEMLDRLRSFWARHRNPTWLFPATGRGWDKARRSRLDAMRRATKPMSISSLQNAVRMTNRGTKLNKNVTCHTLRH